MLEIKVMLHWLFADSPRQQLICIKIWKKKPSLTLHHTQMMKVNQKMLHFFHLLFWNRRMLCLRGANLRILILIGFIILVIFFYNSVALGMFSWKGRKCVDFPKDLLLMLLVVINLEGIGRLLQQCLKQCFQISGKWWCGWRLLESLSWNSNLYMKSETNCAPCHICRKRICSLHTFNLHSMRQMWNFIMETGLEETNRRASFNTVISSTYMVIKMMSRFLHQDLLYKQVKINRDCEQTSQFSGPKKSITLIFLKRRAITKVFQIWCATICFHHLKEFYLTRDTLMFIERWEPSYLKKRLLRRLLTSA